MKSSNIISLSLSNINPIVLNVLIGAVSGYFLLHPISMVIYWFEFNETSLTLSRFFEVFFDRLSSAFGANMIPMAVLFAIIGGLLGLGPGMFIRSIKQKKYELKGRDKLLQKSIPSLIKEGPGQYIEFKSSLKYDYRQAKSSRNIEDLIIVTIAGFMNSDGGMILIGVDSEGMLLGLSNDYWLLKKKNRSGFQQHIISLVANRLGKDLCAKLHISFHQFGGKEICSVFVEPSNHPVYISDNIRTIFYLRTGNITNSLTTREAVEYLQTKHH